MAELCDMSHAPRTVFVVRDDLAYDTGSGDVIAVCPTREVAERVLARAKEPGASYYDPEIVEVPMIERDEEIDWPGVFAGYSMVTTPWKWHERWPLLVPLVNRLHPDHVKTLRAILDGKYVRENEYLSLANTVTTHLGWAKTMELFHEIKPRLKA